jgi:hypothetical protein
MRRFNLERSTSIKGYMKRRAGLKRELPFLIADFYTLRNFIHVL